jgi:hypothetical protein
MCRISGENSGASEGREDKEPALHGVISLKVSTSSVVQASGADYICVRSSTP